MKRRSAAIPMGMAGMLALTTSASATDHALLIGGGPTPETSQVSIEKNIAFARSTLPRIGLPPDLTTVLFGSGRTDHPDVCYSAPPPVAYEMLARWIGPEEYVALKYRPTVLKNVRSAATRREILAQLERSSRDLHSGDRLLVFVAGHGGEGERIENGYFYCWGRRPLDVREFTSALDSFDPEVEVIVVMAQCYAGTFANLLFEQGDPDKPLARHRRAGFFATAADLESAGCSADGSAEDVREYGGDFWSAVGRRNQTGAKVSADDVDGNGVISFAEAHAYALIHSPTIDVGCKTSDLFLRAFADSDPRDEKLLRHDRDFTRLLGVAAPCERLVLSALSRRVRLDGEERIAEATRECERIDEERASYAAELRRLTRARRRRQAALAEALLAHWPILVNPWRPEAHAFLADHSDEVMAAARDHRGFDRLTELASRIRALEASDLESERQWAKYQRLIETARSVALAFNLRFRNQPELIDHYEDLLDLENSWPKKGPVIEPIPNPRPSASLPD